MKNKRFNRSVGNRAFSKRKKNDYNKNDYNKNDFKKSEKFQTYCDQCGDSCEVPFKPTQGKPVLCSNCFEKKEKDHGSHRRSPRRERSPQRNSNMYTAVCDSCGQDCEVPFKPTIGKPVFCDNCFESKKVNEMEELKLEIAVLNSKIDKVLKILKTVFAVKKYKGEIKDDEDSVKKIKYKVKKDEQEDF